MSLKKIIFISSFSFLLIGVLSILGMNAWVKLYSNPKCHSKIEKISPSTVAIIFGAGVRKDRPSKYLKDRLDAGILLYQSKKVTRLLLSGDNGRKSYDEISVMKNYCLDKGVNPDHIFLDYAGFDTYSTLFRAKHIFKVKKAVLVSQNYHLDRAVFTGNLLGIESSGFIANKGSYAGYRMNSIREFFAVAKSGLDLLGNRKPKYLGKKIDIMGKSNFND